tara:strand:+ start:372 stop:947 length:576 start_codon:yes stop_codon:yes gene_type:complete
MKGGVLGSPKVWLDNKRTWYRKKIYIRKCKMIKEKVYDFDVQLHYYFNRNYLLPDGWRGSGDPLYHLDGQTLLARAVALSPKPLEYLSGHHTIQFSTHDYLDDMNNLYNWWTENIRKIKEFTGSEEFRTLPREPVDEHDKDDNHKNYLDRLKGYLVKGPGPQNEFPLRLPPADKSRTERAVSSSLNDVFSF